MTVVESASRLNEEQRAAADAMGVVFVSAGAGTGKTSVLVERFVRATCDRGIDVGSVLVITYTRKAAGELRARIREALLERGRADLARELDGAWISTIHGFCSRVLRQHPFEVGLDPRFRELDEPTAAVLRAEAFERALSEFCHGQDPERLRLLATYGAAGLRRMLTRVHETLRSAGRDLVLELGERRDPREAVAAFREAAQSLAADDRATETQRANAELALGLVPPDALAERIADLGAVACRGVRAATYEEARRGVERSALEALAATDRDLLQELLERYAGALAAAKRRESAVDFEDLQLLARDLLRDHDDVRRRQAERFRVVMVDEFQDTNRLQCEIVDAVSGPDTEVFFVGDEFQSIYGFRHADVEVFRERRAAAPNLHALSRNFRSRPEVLAAINHLFGPTFGSEFQPLAASGAFPDPTLGHPVELLVTDKQSFRGTGEHWRQAEARAIASRVRALVDNDAALPGEIVLLFAAGTDAELYEHELRLAGLPTYRAIGRSYFGQQQVADLLAYLSLLQNRYDDRALATVLASPFVGISNDTLVSIRRNATRRPLFTGIEKGLPEGLAHDDARLLRAFLQRYERLVASSRRLGLEQLCERILVEHDYDLAVLSRWDGGRRYANLRKLARMARQYESARGPDLEGFVRYVRDQGAFGARELEAVAEEEGADAVRLLTIHGAKGLEFKVVIVADAGRDSAGPSDPDEIVALSDGRFGFRVVHPTRGDRHPVFDYEAVQTAGRDQERSERLRLYYVAMTRAIDRLIVSGAIDVDRAADRETPIGWVLGRLEAHDELSAVERDPVELVRGDARFLVRVTRFVEPAIVPVAPHVEERTDEPGQLSLFTEIPDGPSPVGLRLPELAALPRPAGFEPRRLSYSALALFERCSYRFWAERVAGMRPRRMVDEESGIGGLHATEIGDAVHRLLEGVSLDTPSSPDRATIAATVEGWYPAVTAAELDRIATHVEAYCRSSLARRVASLGGARPERPFTFLHDDVLLVGRLDVLHERDRSAFVLDFKTNAIEGREAEHVVTDEYVLQRTVYALACLRAEIDEVEVVYQFLERPEDVVSATFARNDLPSLESVLSDAIGRIRLGDFHPTPSPFTCSGCPALDVVCAGPRLGRGDDEPW